MNALCISQKHGNRLGMLRETAHAITPHATDLTLILSI